MLHWWKILKKVGIKKKWFAAGTDWSPPLISPHHVYGSHVASPDQIATEAQCNGVDKKHNGLANGKRQTTGNYLF